MKDNPKTETARELIERYGSMRADLGMGPWARTASAREGALGFYLRLWPRTPAGLGSHESRLFQLGQTELQLQDALADAREAQAFARSLDSFWPRVRAGGRVWLAAANLLLHGFALPRRPIRRGPTWRDRLQARLHLCWITLLGAHAPHQSCPDSATPVPAAQAGKEAR